VCCDAGMDFDSYARRLWAGRADAYQHGFARLTVHVVAALLAEAGFTETAAQVLTWEFRVDPQEWWQVYRSSVGSSGAVIARQDDAAIERIKGEFGNLAARYATGDGAVALPARAVLASATRP